MSSRRMVGLVVVSALMILGGFFVARSDSTRGTTTAVRRTTASRQSIRNMPILQRPNRPGHIYGNTVRRLHARRTARQGR